MKGNVQVALKAEEKLKSQIECLDKSYKEALCRIENLEKSNRKANARIEQLEACDRVANRQIEDLNSSLTFLRPSAIASPPPLADIVLVASDDPSPLPISANRAILACRSPVFQAMLENKMEESINGMIKICEVSNDTLGMFVNFLYIAEACLLSHKTACELLMLGDKYQIPHLKTYCDRFLNATLTWESSLPIYAFARQYNYQTLKDASLSLIIKDIKKLPKRQDYAQFVQWDPGMVLEIYEAGNDR